ncbi:protein FAM217B [Brachyhypopomus gauderio]|uniref:protein FAM217B n=1 Tax=Brachyhypopomus gauderio TaxID=698409 RepID=UPI0040431D80
MRTVQQEWVIHSGHNNLTSHSRPKTKISRNASRDRRSTNTPRIPEKDGNMAVENGLQIRGTDRASVVITATVFNPRELATKPKSQPSLKAPRERSLRKKTRCSSARSTNVATEPEGLTGSSPLSLMSAPAPRREPSEALPPSEGAVCVCVPGTEDTDGDSDLSDTERFPEPPSITSPPQLHLQAEALDRCDFQASPPPCPGQRRPPREGYPDFLPPPFNSWSLQQLAVYLNTDGRGVARPRPASHLERYLDRLLRLEWHQIQTVLEESSGQTGSTSGGFHRPQATAHCNLSTPKSILHCPRAFPLALLSSLSDTPPSSACLSCRNHHRMADSACHSRIHPRSSHLSPLPEVRGRATGPSRRSSSETRTRQVEHAPAPRHHRLSDPLDTSSHLKRMQAIGNIRNPAASLCGAQGVSSATSLEVGALRRRGHVEGEGRSRSCGDMKARAGNTVHKPPQNTRSRPQSPGATGSGELQSSIDSIVHSSVVTRKPTGKQKHVEFVIT